MKALLKKQQGLKVYTSPQPCSFILKEVTYYAEYFTEWSFFQKTDLGHSSIWTFTCQTCKCFGSHKGKVPHTPGKPGTWSLLLPPYFTSHWHGAQGEAQKGRKQNPLVENLERIVSSFKQQLPEWAKSLTYFQEPSLSFSKGHKYATSVYNVAFGQKHFIISTKILCSEVTHEW